MSNEMLSQLCFKIPWPSLLPSAPLLDQGQQWDASEQMQTLLLLLCTLVAEPFPSTTAPGSHGATMLDLDYHITKL